MKGKKEMKKTIRTAFAGLLLVPVLALGISAVAGSVDVSAQILNGLNSVNTGNGPTNLTGTGGAFTTIVNVLLFIIGAISVIVIIIAGIRYTSSGGNANAVAGAKNMLLYGIVGLVVAIFAFAVVSFVVDRTMSPTNTSTSTTP